MTVFKVIEIERRHYRQEYVVEANSQEEAERLVRQGEVQPMSSERCLPQCDDGKEEAIHRQIEPYLPVEITPWLALILRHEVYRYEFDGAGENVAQEMSSLTVQESFEVMEDFIAEEQTSWASRDGRSTEGMTNEDILSTNNIIGGMFRRIKTYRSDLSEDQKRQVLLAAIGWVNSSPAAKEVALDKIKDLPINPDHLTIGEMLDVQNVC